MTRKFVKFSKHFSLCWRERKVVFSHCLILENFICIFDCVEVEIAQWASPVTRSDWSLLSFVDFSDCTHTVKGSAYIFICTTYIWGRLWTWGKNCWKNFQISFCSARSRCLFTWLCWARLTGEWIRETSFDLIWISTTRMSKRSRNIHNTQHQCQLQIQKSINLIVSEEIFRLLELRRRQKPKRREIKTFCVRSNWYSFIVIEIRFIQIEIIIIPH